MYSMYCIQCSNSIFYFLDIFTDMFNEKHVLGWKSVTLLVKIVKGIYDYLLLRVKSLSDVRPSKDIGFHTGCPFKNFYLF